MKNIAVIALLLVAASNLLFSQHTFSIVAVDTITGEVGSAGASCLDDISFPGSGGAFIISDVLPGIGAIHTQSFYLAQNQANARARMLENMTAAGIIAWLKANDAENNPNVRQYGVVRLDAQGASGRAWAYTGPSCFNYKNHRIGANYAIQGNILKGKAILDSMESRFLAAQGTLADRLMASLQGANVVGADTRCTSNGTSSLSAFLRVAKPGDAENALYLDLNVPALPAMTEPIDSVQTLYDNWKLTRVNNPGIGYEVKLFPNPAKGQVVLQLEGRAGFAEFFDLAGKKVFEKSIVGGQNVLSPGLQAGVYIVKVSAEGKTLLARKLFWQ